MDVTSSNFIDLTEVDSSDEECMEIETDRVKSVSKFVQSKFCRSSRLQRPRAGSADVVNIANFSRESLEHYVRVLNSQKETYVGASTNPFLGNALFALTAIKEGEFICVYLGLRMSKKECKARLRAGCNDDYILNLPQGVYVDGFQVGAGAAMANHSCDPNTKLDFITLEGIDKAPVGILQAIKDINPGDELEADYNNWNPKTDPMPDLNDRSSYVPCRCLKPQCKKVLKLVLRGDDGM